MKPQNEFWAIVLKKYPDVIWRTSDCERGFKGRLAIFLDKESAEDFIEVLRGSQIEKFQLRKVFILELEAAPY